jgi:hypothetical protein
MPSLEKQQESYTNVKSQSPHLRLHIFLSILTLLVVSSAIYIYHQSIANNVVQSPPNDIDVQIEGLKMLNEKINTSVTIEEKIEGLRLLNEKNNSLNK